MDALSALTEYFMKHNVVETIRPPPDCPRYRLKDVLEAKKGRVPRVLTSTFNSMAKPYITIKAFERGIVDWYVESDDGVSVTDNDLVIVWDGARSGLVGKGRDGILGSTLKKLTPKEEFSHVPPSYVRYFLQMHNSHINRNTRGSVIQHVDPDLFWSLKIPIPEQDTIHFRKISTLVQALDDIEDHTLKQLQLVRKMKQSVLAQSFRPDERANHNSYDPK